MFTREFSHEDFWDDDCLRHKVRTYKEYHSVSPSSELGLPPHPPPAGYSVPLPPVSGGRGTLAGEKGVGRVPIPTRGIHCGTLYMYVLCGLRCLGTASCLACAYNHGCIFSSLVDPDPVHRKLMFLLDPDPDP